MKAGKVDMTCKAPASCEEDRGLVREIFQGFGAGTKVRHMAGYSPARRHTRVLRPSAASSTALARP